MGQLEVEAQVEPRPLLTASLGLGRTIGLSRCSDSDSDDFARKVGPTLTLNFKLKGLRVDSELDNELVIMMHITGIAYSSAWPGPGPGPPAGLQVPGLGLRLSIAA